MRDLSLCAAVVFALVNATAHSSDNKRLIRQLRFYVLGIPVVPDAPPLGGARPPSWSTTGLASETFAISSTFKTKNPWRRSWSICETLISLHRGKLSLGWNLVYSNQDRAIAPYDANHDPILANVPTRLNSSDGDFRPNRTQHTKMSSWLLESRSFGNGTQINEICCASSTRKALRSKNAS
jgi:hypothetical protein